MTLHFKYASHFFFFTLYIPPFLFFLPFCLKHSLCRIQSLSASLHSFTKQKKKKRSKMDIRGRSQQGDRKSLVAVGNKHHLGRTTKKQRRRRTGRKERSADWGIPRGLLYFTSPTTGHLKENGFITLFIVVNIPEDSVEPSEWFLNPGVHDFTLDWSPRTWWWKMVLTCSLIPVHSCVVWDADMGCGQLLW